MIPSSKTIVVLGASYGGARAAKLLAESIPENWRIIVIERNSHANHLYVIPRYTVVSGHEHKAFIPYTNLYGPCPTENLVLQASVVKISERHVTISRPFPQFSLSNQIPFDYCVYALGSHLPAPIDVWGENEECNEENVDVLGDEDDMESSDDRPRSKGQQKKNGSKLEAIEWLKRGQRKIKGSENILIIGGGALGIQFASDIKDVYPEKHVTLLHSRPRLLPRFDPLMHSEIARGLEDLGVELLLSTRLDLASLSEHGKVAENGHRQRIVRTTSGQTITADLVLLCTGQIPNTTLLREFAPDSIDLSTGYAKVNRALQLIPVKEVEEKDSLEDKLSSLDLEDSDAIQPTPYGHVFVVGDAADAFGAIKAGHNAYYQAEVASRNILRLISNRNNSGSESEEVELEAYEPGPPMIKLSLGLDNAVYQTGALIGWKDGQNEDLDAPLIWNYYGADINAPGGMMR